MSLGNDLPKTGVKGRKGDASVQPSAHMSKNQPVCHGDGSGVGTAAAADK